MDSVAQLALHRGGGHDFSNHARNVRLLLAGAQQVAAAGAAAVAAGAAASSPLPFSARGGAGAAAEIGNATTSGTAVAAGVPANLSPLPLRKTGTTICGVVCKGGVVLGADTRATEGSIIADKDCSKLHRIADNIYAAGAGTAADLDHMCDWLAVQVELHRLNTNAKPRISMAVCVMSQELFKYQGYKVCALVLGGVDVNGPRIYTIHPHGSTDHSNFAAMGSGSLNAMAVLDAEYRDDMSLEEGKTLVCKAIQAGIFNDLGSGGSVDLCVITEEKAEHLRHYATPVQCAYSAARPHLPHGITPVLSEKIEELKSRLEVTSQEVEMIEA